MIKHLIGIFILIVTITAVLIVYETLPTPAPTASFGGMSLRLDYATTSTSRERGLGGRANVAEDYGMLFVFPAAGKYGFWMKDMLVPIDIFWLDDKGQVIAIEQEVATSTYPDVFYPPVPIKYVLETAAGFAHTHHVSIGTPLVLQKFPTVSE